MAQTYHGVDDGLLTNPLIVSPISLRSGNTNGGDPYLFRRWLTKRAEIAGQITRFEQQLGQFRADLTHVDATIRLFAPDLEPGTIPAKVIRRSDGWFASGEVKRRVLDTLRRSGQPMRAPDVVRTVMVEKGLDPADRRAFAKVQQKVGSRVASAHRARAALVLGPEQWGGALADRRSGGLIQGLPVVTLPVACLSSAVRHGSIWQENAALRFEGITVRRISKERTGARNKRAPA